jgi:hypothetical protein
MLLKENYLKKRELQQLRQRDEMNNDALAALSERLMELEAKFKEQQHHRQKQEVTRTRKN